MAKRFVFRLEAVLRVRKQAEDLQRQVVADHARRVADDQDQARRLASGLDTQREAARLEHQTQKLDLAALRCRYFYMARLDRELIEARRRFEESEVALQQERTKLGTLSARRKVIDKLREKQWSRHQTEIKRAQQAQDDEVAARPFMGHGALSVAPVLG